ncbi:hypothetical protein ANN_07878 [Periplaneta americana]|uniref:Uncharacterized protein n=1 Tax=Periplaneta americana TaxID=6978 RepID=A0ABQ8SZU7_PERAM|nr:hypothetical protein ANN_07878 [Periplaneta americana]
MDLSALFSLTRFTAVMEKLPTERGAVAWRARAQETSEEEDRWEHHVTDGKMVFARMHYKSSKSELESCSTGSMQEITIGREARACEEHYANKTVPASLGSTATCVGVFIAAQLSYNALKTSSPPALSVDTNRCSEFPHFPRPKSGASLDQCYCAGLVSTWPGFDTWKVVIEFVADKANFAEVFPRSTTVSPSRAVASWSKASCLGLALRNARWFESSWGKKFSHEISASVWDRCPPSIVMHLGSYGR